MPVGHERINAREQDPVRGLSIPSLLLPPHLDFSFNSRLSLLHHAHADTSSAYVESKHRLHSLSTRLPESRTSSSPLEMPRRSIQTNYEGMGLWSKLSGRI